MLDNLALNWAFEQLDTDLNIDLTLSLVSHIYEVQQQNGTTVQFNANLNETATQFEKQYAGSGQAYKKFVANTYKVYRSLQPLTFKSHPTSLNLLMNRSIFHAPFMLRLLDNASTMEISFQQKL